MGEFRLIFGKTTVDHDCSPRDSGENWSANIPLVLILRVPNTCSDNFVNRNGLHGEHELSIRLGVHEKVGRVLVRTMVLSSVLPLLTHSSSFPVNRFLNACQ